MEGAEGEKVGGERSKEERGNAEGDGWKEERGREKIEKGEVMREKGKGERENGK